MVDGDWKGGMPTVRWLVSKSAEVCRNLISQLKRFVPSATAAICTGLPVSPVDAAIGTVTAACHRPAAGRPAGDAGQPVPIKGGRCKKGWRSKGGDSRKIAQFEVERTAAIVTRMIANSIHKEDEP